jgi:hypothetical protein
MNDTEWKRCTDDLMQRWPAWKPAMVEVEDFARSLKGLDATVVAEAMFQVRAKYSSDTPKLKWLLDQIKVLHDQENYGYAAALTARQQMNYTMDAWEKDQHDVSTYLMAADAGKRNDAFDVVVARPFMASLVGPDVDRGDPMTWGYTLRSFVWCVMTQTAEPYHHIRGVASCSQD